MFQMTRDSAHDCEGLLLAVPSRTALGASARLLLHCGVCGVNYSCTWLASQTVSLIGLKLVRILTASIALLCLHQTDLPC